MYSDMHFAGLVGGHRQESGGERFRRVRGLLRRREVAERGWGRQSAESVLRFHQEVQTQMSQRG